MSFTRILMTTSASYLAALGLVAAFAPDVVLSGLGAPEISALLLGTQILGALYLGFAGLNWMARRNLIGGIYSRPIVAGNLMHFLAAALAIVKTMAASFSYVLLFGIAAPYAV